MNELKQAEQAITLDPRQADAAYQSFPTFAEWMKCPVDTVRWDNYTAQLNERGKLSAEILERAKEVVRRAAAVDTGALEGLYEVDRGFTFTVATQALLWEAMVDGKGPKMRALFESQLKAYEYVLDLATQNQPISEAAIRALHEQVCEAQETYTAYTEVGIQELRLPKGQYKSLPNHVLGRDGKPHSYAPVDLTPIEMNRLCNELRSEAFQAAHPVLQASYAHYAFVLIHPFADGNGRVARALASVYTYRSHSIPLLILNDNKEEYLSSLSAADGGDYQKFVDFILERALDGIRIVDESVRAASAPSLEDEAAKLRSLYRTKGGYDHLSVDYAGFKLVDLVFEEVNAQASKLEIGEVATFQSSLAKAGGSSMNESYRFVAATNHQDAIGFLFASKAPANAEVRRTLVLEVPKDCGFDDDLIIRNSQTGTTFAARMHELEPVPTAALKIRLSIAIQRILAEALKELSVKAAESLKQNGY